jgi:preprotein translocase subunit SecB
MSMTTNGGETPPTGQPLPAQLNVILQYVKDFSFENPNAPRPMLEPSRQPAINIQINVNPRQLSATDFEIELKVEGKAEADGSTIFAFDLAYAGLFRLQNIPQEHLGPLVMVECPRILFPFAREIIASATVNGGFPPLLLDPVDFASLYQQRMAQQGQPRPTPQP